MIKKAVITAAGLGTRFLPITKAQPKEMLPVVHKPVIQYVVEEVYLSGIKELVIVTGRHKRAVEDHVDGYIGKKENEYVNDFERVLEAMNIFFVRQKEQRGLGDAVRYAEAFVGDDPFALLLGDNITIPNCTEILIDIFEELGAPVVAIEKVSIERARHRGIIKGRKIKEDVYLIEDMFEKPERPISNLGIIGRYVLTPDVFNYLRETEPGYAGEIQLTDALRNMVLDGKEIYGYLYPGRRFDIGNKIDWFKANIELGLRDEEIGKELREWIHKVKGYL
ncbi:MAG: UTP--glucose-1-phosphate uridylyltransferase [Methanomassiliicoccales archaeon]|nr:MAG: UTP--glucose-1-phosphate uridylyltransferase [Methanomassiliicoccales archaeon]